MSLDPSALPFNLMDAGFFLLVGFSTVVAAARGALRELLTVLAWVGAVMVTLMLMEDARASLAPRLNNELLTTAVAAGGLFFSSLIVLSLMVWPIGYLTQGKVATVVDRSIGVGFGVVRGLALVGLGYLVLLWILPPPDQPGWMRQAVSMPWIELAADQLRQVFPGPMPEVYASAYDFPAPEPVAPEFLPDGTVGDGTADDGTADDGAPGDGGGSGADPGATGGEAAPDSDRDDAVMLPAGGTSSTQQGG